MIKKWDNTRKKVTKPKTGRSRIVRNAEVDAELLAIFSNKTLQTGDRVSMSDQNYYRGSLNSTVLAIKSFFKMAFLD